jgi:riboflavin-specific deaminase-like protein
MFSIPTAEHQEVPYVRSSLDAAWALLLALRRERCSGGLPTNGAGVWLNADGELHAAEAEDARAQLIWRDGGALVIGPNLPPEVRDFVELYLPLFAASAVQPVVVGHLGQSVDAQIATEAGDSCYVTGPENLTHLHRMRALCDAVLVGAGTVAADDPQLTTRLVDGPNPVRVIIDPQRRIPADRKLFTDGAATTLVACEADWSGDSDEDEAVIGVPRDAEGLSLPDLIAALQRRGLHALFVEGGGVTVTRWMQAGLLDRLQIAIAPVLIGIGRPGLRLPPALSINKSLRPAYRLFRMGEDVLWDFDLNGKRKGASDKDEQGLAPLRLI